MVVDDFFFFEVSEETFESERERLKKKKNFKIEKEKKIPSKPSSKKLLFSPDDKRHALALDPSEPEQPLYVLEEVGRAVGPRGRDLEGHRPGDGGGEPGQRLLPAPADADEHGRAPVRGQDARGPGQVRERVVEEHEGRGGAAGGGDVEGLELLRSPAEEEEPRR